MSDISSLPPATRGTVEDFIHRAEFWLLVSANDRNDFWESDHPDRPGYSYTASDIVEFTKANCLAATAPQNNELLTEFKTKLERDLENSRTSPHNGEVLAQLLSEYLVWIDRIFLFGIITRASKQEGKLVATRPIITLHFEDGLEDVAGNDLEGIFIYGVGELHVNLLQESGEYQHFDHVFCIVVHELIHVYLHVLMRERSAAAFLRDIAQDHGHGVQFQTLLHFVLTRLFELVPAMTHLDELLMDTAEDLRDALAKPSVSDVEARLRLARLVERSDA
ncbi:hypothetical protein GGS21DRAFT_22903 [Xylaria nigripes]|nr:hypothetical protein GGS21DRAFT_22903 [Xylaria nigripes]